MERSDTLPELPPRPSVDPEVSDTETLVDRMMRMITSLRTELYELHARHSKLVEEYLILKKEVKLTPIRVLQNSVEDNAVSSGTGGEAQSILCSDEGDRAQTLTIPTTEGDCGEADESDVPRTPSLRRALTPV